MRQRSLFLSLFLALAALAKNTEKPAAPLSPLCEIVLKEHQRAEDRRPTIEAAQKLFDKGTQITPDDAQAVAETKAALGSKALVVFDAAFDFQSKIVRASVLQREHVDAAWKLVEIFPSMEVKKSSATYRFSKVVSALRANGIGPALQSYLHLNPEYRTGGKEPLFLRFEYTGPIEVPTMEEGTEEDGDDWKANAPLNSVLHLQWIHHTRRKAMLKDGISDFSGVLANYERYNVKPTAVQLRMLQALATGATRFVDQESLVAGFKAWDLKNPLSFIDFETMSHPVPRYPGTRPFQQIPFQFSAHVNGQQIDYLHTDDTDPRLSFIKAVLETLPNKGSIVAYNMEFESGRLKELADEFPKYRDQLLQVQARLVDPLDILKISMYDLQLRGSYSLKSVAPALFGPESSYEGMEVSDGVMAQAAFEVLTTTQLSPSDRAHLRSEMIKYCAKDTEQMRRVVEWMLKEAGL